MTLGQRPTLILPVETKVRELDAKVLQACALVERGFRVLLGDQNVLLRNAGRLPVGLYVDKSVARRKVRTFGRLLRLGFLPVAWCEEGLVYRDRDAYLDERIAPVAFDIARRFFAWGEVQAADVATKVSARCARGATDKISVTGNPRFDLLRPELRGMYDTEAEALRRRYGRFVLINTNFGRYNHFHGPEHVLETIRRRGTLSTPEKESFFAAWIGFIGEVFHSFRAMTRVLAAAFPEVTVVVRPHPSENARSWREIADTTPNVVVCAEGPVVPWLLAADVSIHNSCTTGVEAALLGRPVLAFQPATSDIYDSFLPNRVSVQVFDTPSLLDRVAEALAGRYAAPLEVDPAVRADLARYVCALDGQLAVDRIADLLAEEQSPARGDLARSAARLGDRLEQGVRGVARTAIEPFRRSEAYARQKFPGLGLEEVAARVRTFERLTDRFSRVGVGWSSIRDVLVLDGPP